MTAEQLEKFIMLCIAFGLAFAIYVILYHPEWLMWIVTQR